MPRFKVNFPSSRTICAILSVFVLFYSTVIAQDGQQEEEVPLPDLQALAEAGEDPIKAMFGQGYICLHIDDPKHANSKAFQAFALELAKKYNKKTKVHVGSNETEVHEHVKWTPGESEEEDTGIGKNKKSPKKKPGSKLVDAGKKIRADNAKKSPSHCHEAGFFIHPTNCNKYYRCVEPVGKETRFKKFYFACGPGTIFDESISACNYPENVDPKPPCFKEEDHDDIPAKGEPNRPVPPPAPQQQIMESEEDPDEVPPEEEDDDDSDGIKKVHSKPSKPKPGKGEDDDDDSWIPKLPDGTEKDKKKPKKKKISEAIDDVISKIKSRAPKKPTPAPVASTEDEDEEPHTCTEQGSFPNDNDCEKYYDCTIAKGGYQMNEYKCDDGEIFDPPSEECKKSSEVSPKPKCWHKSQSQKTVTEEEEIIEEDEEDTVVTKEKTSMIEQTSSEEVGLGKNKNAPKKKIKDKVQGIVLRTNLPKKPKKPAKGESDEVKQEEEDDSDTPMGQVHTKPKPKPKPKKPSKGGDDGQQEEDDTEVPDENPDDVTDDDALKKNHSKNRKGQTTDETEEIEYIYEEEEDGNGNTVKKRKRRTKDEEIEYIEYEDEEGNVKRRPKPKKPTKGEEKEEEWETFVDKDGKTRRRRKKIITTVTTYEEGDEEYEEDEDDKLNPNHSAKKKNKKGKDDEEEYEIITLDNGKKVRRRKKTTTTTTTTSWNTTESSEDGQDSDEVTDKKPKIIKKKKPEEDVEYEYEEFTDEDGVTHRRKTTKKKVTTTTTIIEEGEEEDDEDGKKIGKVHSKPKPKKPKQKPGKEKDNKKGTTGQEQVGQEELTGEDPEPESDSEENELHKNRKNPPKKPKPGKGGDSDAEPEKHEDCDDQSELIARLTRERDEALGEVETLTVAKAKLEKDLAKTNKSLQSALKAKEAMIEHMKKIEKTSDSYKNEADFLKTCCDAKDGGGVKSHTKSRRRRSIDTTTPFPDYVIRSRKVRVPQKDDDGLDDYGGDLEETKDTKPSKVRNRIWRTR